MFGENLTAEGRRESEVRIGDRFRCGTAGLRATEPRLPCSKLNLRFGRDDMIRRFLDSGRSGIYFAVEREGDVGAGDPIEAVHREAHDVTVADVTGAYSSRKDDVAHLRRVAAIAALPDSWRVHIRKRLDRLGAE
jgi:MOSC domain-containing protein YiiM